MSLDEEARAELRALDQAHRLRVPRVMDKRQGPTVLVDGLEVVNFASNDYLGLAGDPRILRAAMSSLENDGFGAGASRLIVGNHRRHVELEAAVADWLRCEGVRVFATGYAANVGVLSTLARAGDVVFSDELNHASIIDGCRLSRAEVVVYSHRDLDALEQALVAPRGGGRRIVVSESLFSMDGDLADVGALRRLCNRYDASLILDEAHAIGVIGPEGRGLAAQAQVVPDLLIGTFGKALGSFGAFVATSQPIADLLWNRARSFVFSTGLPPSTAAATTAAIAIVRGDDGEVRRKALVGHARRLRAMIPSAGGDLESPIAPVLVGDDRRVMQIAARMLEHSVLVQGIRPPTVPEGTARLRLSLSAGHHADHLDVLAKTYDNAVR